MVQVKHRGPACDGQRLDGNSWRQFLTHLVQSDVVVQDKNNALLAVNGLLQVAEMWPTEMPEVIPPQIERHRSPVLTATDNGKRRLPQPIQERWR